MSDIYLGPTEVKAFNKLMRSLKRDLMGGKPEALPDAMPDGSPITCVQDVATMTHKSLYGAAVLIMQHKDDPAEERSRGGIAAPVQAEAAAVVGEVTADNTAPEPPAEEESGWLPQPESDMEDSLCLMFEIPYDIATDLAPPDGVNPDNLHVTLAYFGNASDFPEVDADSFTEYAREIAQSAKPFDVNLNGLTRFSDADGEGGNDAVVVNADSPELEAIRRTTMDLAEGLFKEMPEQNHGFSPHMTLGYVATDTVTPILRWPSQKVRISVIKAAYGDETRLVALGDGKDVKPPERAVETPPDAGQDSTEAATPGEVVPPGETKDVYRGPGSIPITASVSPFAKNKRKKKKRPGNKIPGSHSPFSSSSSTAKRRSGRETVLSRAHGLARRSRKSLNQEDEDQE